jgi:hypothetical protein
MCILVAFGPFGEIFYSGVGTRCTEFTSLNQILSYLPFYHLREEGYTHSYAAPNPILVNTSFVFSPSHNPFPLLPTPTPKNVKKLHIHDQGRTASATPNHERLRRTHPHAPKNRAELARGLYPDDDPNANLIIPSSSPLIFNQY